MSKALILHLSDIHLSTLKFPNNPILSRQKQIISSIKSIFASDVSACIILVAGDIAFAGLKDEYDLAKDMLDHLRGELLREFPQARHQTILLPGNHDLDFSLDSEARRTLIANGSLLKVGDGSLIEVCTAPQKAFFEFAGFSPESSDFSAINKLLFEHTIETSDHNKIVFRTLNTAWLSRVQEKGGSLVFPVEAARRYFRPTEDSAAVITALHHPYTWFAPDNAREIRNFLDSSSDLVITGHEHEATSYTKTGRLGEQNEYIEGGPLQVSGDPTVSEFNVIELDFTERTFGVRHYIWKDGYYDCERDAVYRPFIRNTARLQHTIQLSETITADLNDCDIEYQHPFKNPVTLDDIFVYPDLREYSPQLYRRRKSNAGVARNPTQSKTTAWQPQTSDGEVIPKRAVVRGKEILDQVLTKKRITITGPERSGKTALCRRVFRDLQRLGKVPILLSVRRFDPKQFRNISSLFDQLAEGHYGKEKTQLIWSLPSENRVLIVDDYDMLTQNGTTRKLFISECAKRFDYIIVAGHTQLRYQELIGSDNETTLLVDFVHYEILSVGHRLLSELVKRWIILGRPGELSDEEVDHRTLTLEKVLTTVIGNNLLPRYPGYILLLIQQLEIRQPVDTGEASYGKLYQALVSQSLARAGLNVDTGLAYASELARHYMKLKIDRIDEVDFVKWHNFYVTEYEEPLDYARMRDGLVKAGILRSKDGKIRFRNRASFYYCAAFYLSSHMSHPEVRAEVDTLTSKLYRDDASNIFLFLCHLNKDSYILERVMENAARLLEDIPPADFIEDTRFTGDLVAKLDVKILESGTPAERRAKMHEQNDDLANVEEPDDEMYAYTREDESDLEGEHRRRIAQLNAATKTILIIGQLLRSISGSLKGSQKQALLESAFSLTLRFLRFCFEAFNFGKEDFGRSLERRFREMDPSCTAEKATQRANATVFFLVEMVTFGALKTLATAVGVERLSMSLKEVKGENPSVNKSFIDMAIRLEHFSSFPEDEFESLWTKVHDSVLLRSVLRTFVYERMAFTHVDYKLRQKLCELTDIGNAPETRNPDMKF